MLCDGEINCSDDDNCREGKTAYVSTFFFFFLGLKSATFGSVETRVFAFPGFSLKSRVRHKPRTRYLPNSEITETPNHIKNTGRSSVDRAILILL